MLRQVSVYGILASGMTLVIISGGIDLAVGSVLGLVSVIFSALSLHAGWPAWEAIPLCLMLGVAFGAVSGGLIARFKMQPFIATLAVMVFARGLAKWLSDGQKISRAVQQADGSFAYVELPRVFSLARSPDAWGENIAVVTLVFLSARRRLCAACFCPSSVTGAISMPSAATRRRPGFRACRSCADEAPGLWACAGCLRGGCR